MGRETDLRIAVIGGGPAGSFFAIYALRYAALAGRSVSVTIYEPKDFDQFGRRGCNMCAGIVTTAVVRQLGELGLTIPPEAVISRVNSYALHTSACTLRATRVDAGSEIMCVYRGAGPKLGHSPTQVGFDGRLLEEAIERGAILKRERVDAVRRGSGVSVESAGLSQDYDLAVLATGVNAGSPAIEGFRYQAPRTGSMCQAELYLGAEQVEARLGSSVHIFLPPDDIASYGILIPKGPYVTASLLGARRKMASLQRFLSLDDVAAVLGTGFRQVCGCLPKIAIDQAHGIADDGFVAVGDSSTTRLYKNGIGSALLTSERAAWTAINHGCTREAFNRNYVPLCRSIEWDNRLGRLLFLEVPVLKHFRPMPVAHCRLMSQPRRPDWVTDLHTRILWGMFTGAYSYRDVFRMVTTPGLVARLAIALGRSLLDMGASAPKTA